MNWLNGPGAMPAAPLHCWRFLNLEPLESRVLPSYTVTDLGTLGGTGSYAYGLNSRGQVTGSSYLSGGYSYDAFLWSAGSLSDLGFLGGGYAVNDLGQVAGVGTAADHAVLWSRSGGLVDLGFPGYGSDINNHSEVVGRKFEGYGVPHAVLWSNGRTLELGTLGGTGSAAQRINEAGVVVGWAEATKSQHAFAWTAAAGMRDLGTLDGKPTSSSGAEGVNDLGQVVGSSFSQKLLTTHAAYFGPKGVLDLGTFGGFSSASDINSWGQVVGDSYDLTGKDRPFITQLGSGHLVDLNTLIPSNSGWYLGIPTRIKNTGQITGSGTINGQEHGYLLTPDTSPGAQLALGTLQRNSGAGAHAGAAFDSGGLREAPGGPVAFDVTPYGGTGEAYCQGELPRPQPARRPSPRLWAAVLGTGDPLWDDLAG
jgi:probable HAF family extracellular repeat protein